MPTLDAERDRAREYLRGAIDRDTIIHTRTDYGRGETDYVCVYVVSGREIIDVSYYVARASGRRVADRGIAVGGGQFHKGLDVADDAWRAVFGESIPQTENWRHIA